MSQAISRRSFLKCAGSGAVSLAAALLTGVSAAAAELRAAGDPALLDGKAAVELLGYAPAPGLGGVLVYLSVENLSGHALPVGESYLQSRRVSTREDLYSMGTGVTAACNGRAVRCCTASAPCRRTGRRWSSPMPRTLPPGAASPSRCSAARTKRNWAWCPLPLPRWAAWWICKPNKRKSSPCICTRSFLCVRAAAGRSRRNPAR